MRIDVLTLFPTMFAPMNESMMWKARDKGLLDLRVIDLRTFTHDKHRTADDIPYGGGGGMIMKPDVLVAAIEASLQSAPAGTPVIYLSPQGRVFSHRIAQQLAAREHLVLLCGHYEGIDERVLQLAVTDEISIGDYVLTGGELPAMVLMDAVVRLLPGVLGAEGATALESHADGVLEGPHYTRPAVFRGLAVPEVLQSGNHAAVAAWRRVQGLRRTWRHRPDLLLRAALSEDERYLLAQFANEDAARWLAARQGEG
ncbi:MAG: tRNA (guanosine(37)-N1)-methyltransferase TrmD [Chloroflexi bacterium]|nr:tRNA (guanosine(37)-N1)-methyltransferase TrmD [Chloroflexota bacterium]